MRQHCEGQIKWYKAAIYLPQDYIQTKYKCIYSWLDNIASCVLALRMGLADSHIYLLQLRYISCIIIYIHEHIQQKNVFYIFCSLHKHTHTHTASCTQKAYSQHAVSAAQCTHSVDDNGLINILCFGSLSSHTCNLTPSQYECECIYRTFLRCVHIYIIRCLSENCKVKYKTPS